MRFMRSISALRNASTPLAAARPSAMAQTISDCPLRISPAAKTQGIEVMLLASVATLPRESSATPVDRAFRCAPVR